jgi:hypothetical protein
MAITTVDQFGLAYDSRYQDFLVSKASLANAAAGQYFSLWTSAGIPSAGSAPGGVGSGPLLPTNITVGAIPVVDKVSPITNYISDIELSTANSMTSYEIHDRLAHQSGFVGNVTTSQIAAFDFNSLLLSANVDERKGDANFSDIQWWLEWYTATGTTASNATINVTFNDSTTGNLTVVAVGGTVRAGRMIPLNSLIAAADQGKYIRGVNSITLSASTGTAGNFGITATRYRCGILARTSNVRNRAIWEQIAFPQVYSQSALFPIVLTSTTTTGVVNSTMKVVYG